MKRSGATEGEQTGAPPQQRGNDEEIEQQAAHEGQSLDHVGEVLMVGGSTLLPGVYSVFEQRFGRQRVRAFQPFEAVAYGAAAWFDPELVGRLATLDAATSSGRHRRPRCL